MSTHISNDHKSVSTTAKPVLGWWKFRRVPALKIASMLVIVLQLLTCLPLQALAFNLNDNSESPRPTQLQKQTGKVNRTVPKSDPLPQFPVFSSSPTDAQITQARVFDEPLTAIGKRGDTFTSMVENKALAQAITAYLKAGDPGNVEPFTEFLDRYPESAWQTSVWLNVGQVYRHTGYFQKALDAWETAWKAGKAETKPEAVEVVNRVGAELAQLNARLGRVERLESLLAELKGRSPRGTTAEMIAGAEAGLWLMQTHPESAFRCGPLALRHLCRMAGLKADTPKLTDFKATGQGTSLAQIAAVAQDLGMSYQMARRSAGAAFVTPAIVHWKTGHFAAVTKHFDDGPLKGKYVVQDPAFGEELVVSQEALEAETSGWSLVSRGELPQGWAAISAQEAGQVWGKAATQYWDPDTTKPRDLKAHGGRGQGEKGLPVYDFHLALASLNIVDTPVGYTPPRGPAVNFTVTYNHREMTQPGTFTYSNLGHLWTHNWLGYAQVDPGNASTAFLYERGGGREIFKNLNSGTQLYDVGFWSQSKLKKLTTGFERQMPDGGIEKYEQSDGGSNPRYFLTQVIDPQGKAVTLSYDSSLRLTAITDAIGQVTELSYGVTGDPLKITQVEDPFGRTATFEYNTSGQLIEITNVVSQASEFTYTSGDLISSLTTPYGTTDFAAGQENEGSTSGKRWVEAIDPYDDKERVEYLHSSGVTVTEGSAPSGMTTTSSDFWNSCTFYWDKRAWSEASGLSSPNYFLKAHVIHWARTQDNNLTTTSVIQHEKRSLENRVWYNYPGQSQSDVVGTMNKPTKIGQIVADNPLGSANSTKLITCEYNEFGHLTKLIDPYKQGSNQGRRTTFTYASNNIDLTQIKQGIEGVSSSDEVQFDFTNNSLHQPLTITDPARKVTTLTYSSHGQPLTKTNAKSQTFTYAYNSNGYLTTVTGPTSETALLTYTYDSAGRVDTVTNSDGYALSYDYDNLDRLTRTTYPDTTYQELTYNKLDVSQVRNRLAQVTTRAYDALRRVTVVTDPLGRETTYSWDKSGGVYQIKDDKDQITTWNRDIQGRVTNQELANGNEWNATYDDIGRLQQVTDAKNRVKYYRYLLDDNLYKIDYQSTPVTTPDVTYQYSPKYNRVTQIDDTAGDSIVYTYHPVTTGGTLGATQLDTVSGDNGDVSYDYDELGRVVTQTVRDVARTITYDALGRQTEDDNALGTFTISYADLSNRVTQISGPNSLTTTLSYYGNSGDRRLQTILNKKGTTTISEREYGYNTLNITSLDRGLATNDTFSYNAAELAQYVEANSGGGTTTNSYTYDTARNMTVEGNNGVNTTSTFNSTNQLVTRQVGSGSTVTLTYDANGNSTYDSNSTNTFDDEDRLLTMTDGNKEAIFTYDCLGNLKNIVGKVNGTAVTNRDFIWCGDQPCWESFNVPGVPGTTVIKRFFAQGVKQDSDKYFYMRDHLGSVTDVMKNNNSSVDSRFHYDPWGRQTQTVGSWAADIGYAGYFHYAPATTNIKLNLTASRAYSPKLGRWLSRDQSMTPGGISRGMTDPVNAYAYAMDNPINLKAGGRATYSVAGAPAGTAIPVLSSGSLMQTGGVIEPPLDPSGLMLTGGMIEQPIDPSGWSQQYLRSGSLMQTGGVIEPPLDPSGLMLTGGMIEPPLDPSGLMLTGGMIEQPFDPSGWSQNFYNLGPQSMK
ncbi:MAG: hypothetical protein HY774_27530 [Acidobacteria bacterium]|nr:hypothetical protein [Acidobacteriota bacterium]